MKISFEDGSYVDFRKFEEKVHLIVAAKDRKNDSNLIVNTVEISKEEFQKLVDDVINQPK